jgi:hypothetical protein
VAGKAMVGVAKMQAMLWLLAAVFMLEAAVGLAQDAKQGHNYYDFFVSLLHVLAYIHAFWLHTCT